MSSTFLFFRPSNLTPPKDTTKKGEPSRLSFLCRCGSGEIRTHGPGKEAPVFKTGAIDHSATLPFAIISANPFAVKLF